MKVYIIIEESHQTKAVRAFRNLEHAKKVKRSLSHKKEYEESSLYIEELQLED
jgi:hypothetical protein